MGSTVDGGKRSHAQLKAFRGFIDQFSGMLKEQTNWRDHWPGNVEDEDRPPPVFIPMKGYTWMYVMIPLALYLVDWSWRKVSRRQPVNVTGIVLHEPDVIEVVVDRWMSHSQPGQVSFFIHNSYFSKEFTYFKK